LEPVRGYEERWKRLNASSQCTAVRKWLGLLQMYADRQAAAPAP